MNPILEYRDGIRAGKYVVSRKVQRLYEKLGHEIEHQAGRYIFDEEKANRPIEFIERFCRNSKGEWAGHTVELGLFQKAFIAALFGFVDAETGLRKYRESLFLVGRKNGKSTMAAGIALYCMIADNEPGAGIFSTATKYAQAKLLFDEARNMVKQSPELSRYIRKRKQDMYCDALMAKFQPLGRNSDTLDGLNASLVVMDELHGVRDRNLYEVMKQSQSARRQPLLLMITTAGTVRECIYDDMYSYACNVLDGVVKDDSFLPVLYELDSAKEWGDPEAWPKANPGLGTIKKLDDLQRKVERAKSSAADLPGILCKDFNVRQNAAQAWLTFDDIDNPETFDLEKFRNCYAIGGADLSITTDLTCATLLFVDKETEKRYVTQMYWLPQESFHERVHKDKIPYDIWKDRGLLRLCAGNTIRYSDVTAWFNEMLNDYGITPLWIYYDSYSARYWVDEMQQYGFPMVRCIQGAKTLSLPMQQMGADLRAKKINYNNSPVLKWCLTNTGIMTDRNGNIVPIKAQQPKMRIDGMASMLDAYVGLMDHYEEFLRA